MASSSGVVTSVSPAFQVAGGSSLFDLAVQSELATAGVSSGDPVSSSPLLPRLPGVPVVSMAGGAGASSSLESGSLGAWFMGCPGVQSVLSQEGW